MRRAQHLARLVVALAATTAPLAAQQPVPPPAVPLVTVTGTVFDSLARHPFAGAEVQLLGAVADSATPPRSYTATTDSSGRYRIDGVPSGAYIAGFFHPVVDSLGLQAPIRRIDVHGGSRVDLALPNARHIASAICPAASITDTTATLVGFVRDATTREPRVGATLQVSWSEFSIGKDGLQHQEPTVDVHTLSNGWFAACGAPIGTTLRLRAREGADTSGFLIVELAGGQLAHRDVFLGASTAVASTDSTQRGMFGATLRRGNARLVGEVRSATGRPVAGARVRLWDGADSTITSDGGAFALTGLPAGSQTVEVRAVGYVPVHQTVDLAPGDDADRVRVTLTSFHAYLDTVRITGRRVYDADRNGFLRRKRSSAMGRFIDREAIDRRNAIRTSDLLQTVPGLQLRYGTFGERVLMRGGIGGLCQPEVILDGMSLTMGMGTGIDDNPLEWVQPNELDGVEIYTTPGSAPLEYGHAMNGCGTILLWTRAAEPKRPKLPRDPDKP